MMLQRLMICIALISFFIGSSQVFALGIVNWVEEVPLHDGRVIEVDRKANDSVEVRSLWPFHFYLEKSNFDQHQIEFSHPDTNQRIAWKGERGFSPVLLDIVEGVPFLVVYGRPDKKNSEIYGCPELPYVYLRYAANGWKPVSVENAPKELINANLSAYDVRNKNGRRLSQADVRRDVNPLSNSHTA